MSIGLDVFLAQCLLVFGLTTPGIAPYTGVYFALAVMLFGLVRFLIAPRQWRGVGAYRMLLASVVLLLVPVPFHWAGPQDLYPLVVILPILFAPGAAAFARRHPDVLSAETMSWALLAGVIGCMGLALFEALVLGIYRPGGDNNPIHFGGISAILGFGAMAGFFIVSGPWRFAFLTGPLMATVAVVLSGSRGPAMAAIGLFVLALLFLAWHWRKSRMVWLLVVVPVLVGGLYWFFMQGSPEFDRIEEMIVKAPATLFDLNAGLYGERVALITGAAGSFLAAPVFGHGFGHMMSSVVPYVDPEFAGIANFDHLHSDLADFGVSGGIFGLAALAVLLLSPLAAARMHAHEESRLGMLYLAGVIAVGYLLLGLTNAVIGMLPQTTIFGVLLGLMVGTAKAGSRTGKLF